jgi:hypothetical protein
MVRMGARSPRVVRFAAKWIGEAANRLYRRAALSARCVSKRRDAVARRRRYKLFNVAEVVIYYAAFIQLDTLLVNVALRHRFAEAGLSLDRHAQEQGNALAVQHARYAFNDPAEFICLNPGWLVRALPLGLVPCTLLVMSRIRRRSPTAA